VVTNIDAGVSAIEAVGARIARAPANSTLRELVGLLIYRADSSRLGYAAYRLLREATAADLKKWLSMEPTRRLRRLFRSGPIGYTKGVFALRPFHPSARRVYQPAAVP
jgi:hypothetical protein